jgi:hypothetical protein
VCVAEDILSLQHTNSLPLWDYDFFYDMDEVLSFASG